MVEESVEHFLRVGNHTSQTSEMIYGHTVVASKPHILYHLSGVDFHHEYSLHSCGEAFDFGLRERPEGDRTQQTDLYALFAGILDGLLASSVS